MTGERLVPIDEPKAGRRGGAERRWSFTPLAVASAASAALIAAAFVPSRQPGEGGRSSEEVIEQAPGERQLRSPDDVIAYYRLDARLDSYISLDKEGRILFDPGRRKAADASGKGRKAGDD